MNVAFALSYLNDRFGGPVTTAKKLGEMMTRMRHEVSYWAVGDGDGSDLHSLAGSVHLFRHGWPRSWHRAPALARGLAMSAADIDLIQISELWPYSTYAASRIACNHDVPYILRPAGGLEPWRLRRGYLRSLKKRLYLKCVARHAMSRAACLQATSEQEAESFRRAGYGGPIAVIPGGVDTEVLYAEDPAAANERWPQLRNRPIVLFMSRLSPEKGLDLLIPLWANLVKSPPFRDAALVIAGPDDRGYAGTVEAMIQKHALGSHVRMLGMVTGPAKRALLSRADVFVLPSYSENFGIVVPEALACQTPVITTTGTPWRQLQTADIGRCVAPTTSEVAEALRELMAMSSSRRSDMGRRGRNLVARHYTWKAAADQFLTLCEAILAGRPIPLHPRPAGGPLALPAT